MDAESEKGKCPYCKSSFRKSGEFVSHVESCREVPARRIQASSMDPAMERESPEDSTAPMRDDSEMGFKRFLFLGPTGAGKSTLLNLLYNDDPTTDYGVPALTSDSSVGVTAFFTEYYHWRRRTVFVDSIGFGDNRYSFEEVTERIRSAARNVGIGFQRIYVVLLYGRVPDAHRGYLEFVSELFGPEGLKYCSLIFTRSPKKVLDWSKQQYMDANASDTEFMKFVDACSSVLFTDNYWPDDPRLANPFLERRKAFLARIKADMESATQLVRPKPMTLHLFIQLVARRFLAPIVVTTQMLRDLCSVLSSQLRERVGMDQHAAVRIAPVPPPSPPPGEPSRSHSSKIIRRERFLGSCRKCKLPIFGMRQLAQDVVLCPFCEQTFHPSCSQRVCPSCSKPNNGPSAYWRNVFVKEDHTYDRLRGSGDCHVQ